MKNSLDFIHSFPEFSHIETPKVEKDYIVPEYDVERNPVLNMIYAPDPNTGLPCGDLACYLGDKTSPEVREFIRLNMLQQIPDVPVLPDELSDEDAFDFIRGKDETPAQYCQRMSAYFKNAESDELK